MFISEYWATFREMKRDDTTYTFIMEHVLFSDAHANSKRTNNTINKSKKMSSNAT